MLKLAFHFAWRGVSHLTRLVLLGAILLLFAGAGTLLALRYWLLPDVEHYHDQITYAFAQVIGQRVSIGKIEADWQGARPRLQLVNVRILDQQGQTALGLERVESEVAWTSLFTGEVRLYSLELDQPNLFVKRDTRGQLFIAGMPLSGAAGNGGSPDWLLNQSRIVVREARITWQDELRAVPPLEFNEVNLVIDNGWRRHRFALRALPPSALSSALDVRGEFYGASFDDLPGWKGQLYTRLDYADVAAWRRWLPLPVPLSRGEGALRSWLEFEQGKVSRVTADLALARVRTRLADDLPVLDLRTLRGRIGWSGIEGGAEFMARHLSLRLRDSLALEPTDFYLRYVAEQEGQWTSGEVRANELDLQGLTELADYLPMDRSFRQRLAAFAPRGKVSGLHAKWRDAGKALRYELGAGFSGLAARQVDGIPGFSGLSGRVEGGDGGGMLSLDSRRLAVDAPGVMQEKLMFDAVTAQVRWSAGEEGVELKLDNVSVSNADLSGELYGSYRLAPGSPGIVDLTAHLTRAAVRRVDRYIPENALNRQTHEWLANALLGGQSDDATLRLAGNLREFPFAGNKNGLFRIHAHVRDVALEFHRDWPQLENVDGELLIEGRRLEVHVPAATTAGNALQKVSAIFPDLGAPDLLLQVYGEAAGETARALDYIRQSPVRGYLGGFTDDATARGTGVLSLLLNIPLAGSKPLRVNGGYRFLGNDIDLGGGIPLLQDTSGELLFTESSVSSRGLVTKTLGGPAAVEVKSGDGGRIEVTASGTADMDVLRNISPLPLLRYLHGTSVWDLRVKVQDKQAETLFTSNLAGLSSDLPAPFAKRADEKTMLRFSQKSLNGQQGEVAMQYGSLFNAKLLRGKTEDGWTIRRGTVAFGEQKKWPERDGVWLVGTVPSLSLEGWGPMLEMGGGHGQLNLGGADLLLQKISGYGFAANNLRLAMHASNGMLFAQLASKEINGDVVWQPQDKGALVVRLKNLAFPGGRDATGAGKPVAAAEQAAGDSPEFHVAVDDLSYKGNHLGKLNLGAKQRAGNWLVERITLDNPDGLLTADGKWLTAGGAAQTQVNFKLEIADAGKTLSRYGYPDSMKGGGGKLEGALSWYGGPDAFSYAVLGGTLKLNMGKGQFLKIDPGVGKLLGILSLQALPQHITLDFTDVFSQGFAFDNIKGTAQISRGVMTTGDFMMEGSAAKVVMAGQVDLGHETQNLRVLILPTVGNSVALLATLVINPVAGIGTFLFNKILQGPLDKLVSFEYNVTGTWSDPLVTKIGASKRAEPINKP